MESFATVAEYEARYGEVDDESVLQECLDDATAAICAALDKRDVDYADPSEEFADRLMRTCRSVANRIMPSASAIPSGATSYTQTAGPYSESWGLSTGYGTPKLVKSELDMLGITSGYIRALRPKIGACDG